MPAQENIGIFTNPQHDLYAEKVDMPGEPGPDEVTINVVACGICGSDVHFQVEGAIGTNVIREPLILGHEASGIITKLGSNVKNHKVGDRVSIEPGASCQECENCTSGKYNGCEKMAFKSCPGYSGLLQRYVNHPARLCFSLGDLSFEEGALMEPLSVALSGVKHSNLTLGDPTIVSGAGPIGILTALVAEAAGASPILIVDVNPARLELAKKLMPSVITHVSDTKASEEENGKKFQELLGEKAQVCLECTGNEQAIGACIYALKFAGMLEIIGCGRDEITIPFMYASFNEMTIGTLFRYTNTWPRLIRLVQGGVLKIKDLVSFKYSYKEAKEAFAKSHDPKSPGIKTMIYMNDE